MKKLLIIVSLFVMTAFALQSCSTDEKPVYATQEEIKLLDVAYGSDPLQKMDVYLPAGRSKASTSLIVLIHGGGWIGGDKDDFPITDENLRVLQEQFPNYAMINLNYRLATETANKYPTAENDIRQAMDYIWKNLNAYQISSKTYILGGSAGAHLAALHTVKYNQNGNIRGCIAISGAYNLTTTYNQSGTETKDILRLFLGGTPTEKPAIYQAVSPVNFVTATTPKFLILHGNGDQLVPVAQASELKATLESKNVPVTYFTYSGGHGIPPEHLTEAIEKIKTFVGVE